MFLLEFSLKFLAVFFSCFPPIFFTHPSDLLEFFPMNEKNRTTIVEWHNEQRRRVNATNMQLMEWNYQLEELAGNWSKACSFDHRPNLPEITINGIVGINGIFGINGIVGINGINGIVGIGENIAVRKFNWVNLTHQMGAWMLEENCFNITTGICDLSTSRCNFLGGCGHFLQILKHDAFAIGCGLAHCNQIDGTFPGSGFVFVCNYLNHLGPNDGIYFESPYVIAANDSEICSQCPTGWTLCDEKLCKLPAKVESKQKYTLNKSRK